VHFGLAGKRLKKRSRFSMIMHKTMEDPTIELGIFLENTRKLGRSQWDKMNEEKEGSVS
jgi:hypothetical protein